MLTMDFIPRIGVDDLQLDWRRHRIQRPHIRAVGEKTGDTDLARPFHPTTNAATTPISSTSAPLASFVPGLLQRRRR